LGADLAPIAGKLANVIRRLASDKDGEVVASRIFCSTCLTPSLIPAL